MNPSMQGRRPGVIAGIAISLLLHALLIFGYRLKPPDAPTEPPPHPLTVWLQPLTPPRIVAKVEPPPKPLPQPRKREKSEQPPTRISPPAPATAQTITLPAPATPDARPTMPDPLYPQQEQQPKKFDMDAALKTARKVAGEKGALQDPARAGTPVAQLDDHPLYPERESQLARDIAGAKRGDCKNTGAGLLSPLIWLLDKKDHGCKW